MWMELPCLASLGWSCDGGNDEGWGLAPSEPGEGVWVTVCAIRYNMKGGFA